MSRIEHWKQFWEQQTTPLHPGDSDHYYRRMAHEMLWLFDNRSFQRVLEIGCGSGSLYRHLGFDSVERYRGVDLSGSMLKAFRAAHDAGGPGQLDLVCAAGHTYRDQNRYDLIFCNSVLQYFTHAMLGEFLSNATAMLQPGGVIIISLAPWRAMRWQYRAGDISTQATAKWRRILVWLKCLLHDPMPYWHSWDEVRRLAQPLGLAPEFHGSLIQPYRFHVILKRA